MRSARSSKHLLVLRAGYFKCLASVKWRAAIWQSRILSRRERRRSSNNQCKHRTSGSTQFYKAVARPASKHQRRSPAHIMSYPGAESAVYKQNPVDSGKQGPINDGSHPSTEVIPQRRIICERNISVQQYSTGRHLASIASSPRINCVCNKVRKTIVSIAAAFVACSFTFKMVDQSEAPILKLQRATINASCTRIRTYVDSIAAINPSTMA